MNPEKVQKKSQKIGWLQKASLKTTTINIKKALSYTCGKIFETVFDMKEEKGNIDIIKKAKEIIEKLISPDPGDRIEITDAIE